jgi:hypothetical protein
LLIASTFVFIAYLFVLFHIGFDLFRDAELGGGFKALWIIGLIFVPVFTARLKAKALSLTDRRRALLIYPQLAR